MAQSTRHKGDYQSAGRHGMTANESQTWSSTSDDYERTPFGHVLQTAFGRNAVGPEKFCEKGGGRDMRASIQMARSFARSYGLNTMK
jgi:hypothetical protein